MGKELHLESKKFEKASRALSALWYAVKYPKLFGSILRPTVTSLYAQGKFQKKRLPVIDSEAILNSQEVRLMKCTLRDGNVSYLEMLILTSLVKKKKAKTIVEIGTFDGNTTLQLALNSIEEAVVHTIDLAEGEENTQAPVLSREAKFILDEKKKQRKYVNSPVAAKVVQHFGDSTTYDFQKFCEKGPIDLCFIDGSHSYASVKSDTEKAFFHLSPTGLILWHDYNPNYQGVYRYINELSQTKEIKLFAGTSLAVYHA